MSTDSQPDITAWINAAGRFPLLPKERVTLMAKQIQSLPSDSPKRRKLINTLVNHNLRLVIKFVQAFMNGRSHNKWGSHHTVDYLQVGAMGLARAAEMYDPTRGYEFSTYANHWIRSTVSRYNLKTASPVSISESAFRDLIFYNRNGYVKLRGKGPEGEQRAMATNRSVLQACACTSLNTRFDNGGEFQDFVPDETTRIDLANFYEALHDAFDRAKINPIGKEILIGYYINEEKPQETADRLGISIYKYKTEKSKAMLRAKINRELFRDGILAK